MSLNQPFFNTGFVCPRSLIPLLYRTKNSEMPTLIWLCFSMGMDVTDIHSLSNDSAVFTGIYQL